MVDGIVLFYCRIQLRVSEKQLNKFNMIVLTGKIEKLLMMFLRQMVVDGKRHQCCLGQMSKVAGCNMSIMKGFFECEGVLAYLDDR